MLSPFLYMIVIFSLKTPFTFKFLCSYVPYSVFLHCGTVSHYLYFPFLQHLSCAYIYIIYIFRDLTDISAINYSFYPDTQTLIK